jgi:glycosyltransferase involved in cell wall biosynthesis
MKVCFVLPSLAGGGSERAAVLVLNALDPSRYERVLYLFNAEGAYLSQLAADVRVVTAARRGWVGRLFELASFLRAERPAVVMPFLSYFIASLAVSLSAIGARVVLNQGSPTTGFLEDPDFSWRRPWRRRLFALMTTYFYGRATAVVVTSHGVGDDLVTNYKVPRSKIRVLHNPVDVSAVTRASESPIDADLEAERPVIAAAGRLAGVKNYPLLLDAVASLSVQTPLHVWILGDGVERERLEAHARSAGLGARVRFLGFQQNPWRFIRRADVFVLTSVYEGFGNVIVEAMACGTPVVATRSLGTSDIVQDDVNGLLVDHQPSAVASAIGRVLTDQPLRSRLLASAGKSVEQYDIPNVAARYARLFEELMA